MVDEEKILRLEQMTVDSFMNVIKIQQDIIKEERIFIMDILSRFGGLLREIKKI